MKAAVLFVALALFVAIGCGSFWLGHHSAQNTSTGPISQPAEESSPVASVKTAKLRRGTIAEKITAYGIVTAEPGEMKIVSVGLESRVERIAVAPGERISVGQILAEVEASPDTQTAFQEARNAVAAGKKDLEQIQQRFNDHLATNQDLFQAQQALQAAQLKLDSLEHRGGDGSQQLKSDVAGVVSKVDVQEGQIVPAGGPLVEIVVENLIEVKLGIEPSEIAKLKSNQPVELTAVHSSESTPIGGNVRLITQRVNADTRLTDVFVSIPKDSGLMLDQFVSGQIVTGAKESLIAPRDGVVPDGDGYSVFTIANEHAVKHGVDIGLQDGNEVELITKDLKEGDAIVTSGNHELTDGMEVKLDDSKDEKNPTTTESTR